MISNLEILDLLDGCIKFERNSQRKFYTSYYSYAMSICMRCANNREDALEIVNDGFLKTFKTISSFNARYEDVEACLKGWIKTIMLNTAIDHLRRNKKYKGIIEFDERDMIFPVEANTGIDKLTYEEIYMLIQKLTPRYRTVFNLYVIDGFKHQEIAMQLNISVGSSKSNLFKARENIQKMLNATVWRKYRRQIQMVGKTQG